MRNRKKLIKQKLLRNSLRDAAAGIKRKPTIPQPQRPSHHPNTSTRVAPATTSAATQSPQRAHRRGPFRLGNCPPFPNPEVLGDTPEPEYEPEGIEADPQYTGGCEKELENNDCSDPDEINKMEFEDRAIWLGKWFAHHYAAWVEDFEMKELQSYPTSSSVGIQRAINVGPLPMLECTFARFRLLEDEWRSPSFCSPFRLGLRRFRNEVVSTVRMHAIRIFGITDIVTIDHRDESQQVTALYTDNKFLYKHGNTGSIGDFMRSDYLVKALRVILFGPAALDGPDKQKSQHVRAPLFNVRTVRNTLVCFIATVLWFLLVDGRVFRDKGTKEGCKKYYRDRMIQLNKVQVELPDIYKAYQEFMDCNVFGKDEEEALDANEEMQKEYMDKFYADVEKEKERRRKGKARAEDVASPTNSTNGLEEQD